MPDIDGLMLVRFFRKNAATRDTPLIVLSSKEEPKVKAEAFALGANDYLVKLPDKVELIARIRYHSKAHINLLQRNEAYKVLENELEKGRQMQKYFLPDHIPQLANWEIAAFFQPARQVAGDFYDVFVLPGDYIGIVVADVCDKGVGAALFMALFRSLLRIFSGQIELSGLSILDSDQQVVTNSVQIHALKAVSLTNNYVAYNHGELGMFATLFFGVLDPATGLLTYINGGHEPPMVINSGVVKHRLAPTGPAVGMIPDVKFKTQQIQLEPGDIVFSYTDGVPEARKPNGDFVTEKKLISLLEQPYSSAAAMIEAIETYLISHIANAAQFDDITMLAVRSLLNN
ncbi:MAG: SpoIIE family protein phosphatase [Crinalium sp.]